MYSEKIKLRQCFRVCIENKGGMDLLGVARWWWLLDTLDICDSVIVTMTRVPNYFQYLLHHLHVLQNHPQRYEKLDSY